MGDGCLAAPTFRQSVSGPYFFCPARGIERKIAPHPSLKPQSFVWQIVRAALPLGRGILVDPFMGSGATIAAATALGLESIGVEIDLEYFQMAEKSVGALCEIKAH